MLYFLIASVYCLILVFSIVMTLIYLFKSKSNMIYISRNLIYLPVFMVIVSSVVAFSGLSKQQVETYDLSTTLINSAFCFIFLIIGSVLIYLITSWNVIFKDTHLEYSSFKESNRVIRYEDIEYIDAFRQTSNGIIHIKAKDKLLKINHNIIMGSISSLTLLISKCRKKK